jgi:hypothetical protein
MRRFVKIDFWLSQLQSTDYNKTDADNGVVNYEANVNGMTAIFFLKLQETLTWRLPMQRRF